MSMGNDGQSDPLCPVHLQSWQATCQADQSEMGTRLKHPDGLPGGGPRSEMKNDAAGCECQMVQ